MYYDIMHHVYVRTLSSGSIILESACATGSSTSGWLNGSSFEPKTAGELGASVHECKGGENGGGGGALF